MAINQVLKNINFFATQTRFAELVALTEQLARNAGQENGAPEFRRLVSHIPAEAARKKLDGQVLIDIGGTSTKVGVRVVDSNGAPRWRVLFEDDNSSFDLQQGPGHSLDRFADAVASRVVAANSEPLKGQAGLGIVWSNAMSNTRTDAGSILGAIVFRENYTKNEWFNQDTKNGDEVSGPFLKAFARHGLTFTVSLVANDTPLTMKALEVSHAGMVASTGVNATIVDIAGSKRTICNAEMGTSFLIPDTYLSLGDRISGDQPAAVIEHLMSGKYLPQIFYSHIIALAKNGQDSLVELANSLQSATAKGIDEFQAEDLSFLLRSQDAAMAADFWGRHATLNSKNPMLYGELAQLAEAIVVRAAQLAALMAYGSICTQLPTDQQLTIALDSRLAREMPIFWQTMQQTLQNILTNKAPAAIRLVDRQSVPGGLLSVPMIGAANALDCLL